MGNKIDMKNFNRGIQFERLIISLRRDFFQHIELAIDLNYSRLHKIFNSEFKPKSGKTSIDVSFTQDYYTNENRGAANKVITECVRLEIKEIYDFNDKEKINNLAKGTRLLITKYKLEFGSGETLLLRIMEERLNQFEMVIKHTSTQTEPKEQHTHIFRNNGFILFEYLMGNLLSKDKGRISDIIYFYWKMYDTKGRTQYIHVKPEPFKKWLEDDSKYEYSIIGWKTLGEVTTKDNKRHNSYTSALDWFKRQKSFRP